MTYIVHPNFIFLVSCCAIFKLFSCSKCIFAMIRLNYLCSSHLKRDKSLHDIAVLNYYLSLNLKFSTGAFQNSNLCLQPLYTSFSSNESARPYLTGSHLFSIIFTFRPEARFKSALISPDLHCSKGYRTQ